MGASGLCGETMCPLFGRFLPNFVCVGGGGGAEPMQKAQSSPVGVPRASLEISPLGAKLLWNGQVMTRQYFVSLGNVLRVFFMGGLLLRVARQRPEIIFGRGRE